MYKPYSISRATVSRNRAPESRIIQSKSKKKRAWVLYFLVMVWVLRTTVFLRQRPGELYAAVDTMAMVQIFLVGLILLVLSSVAVNFFRRQVKGASIQYYFLYVILGMISALWSLNPMYSLYRSVEVMALSAAVLYFCTTALSLEESIRRIQIISGSTLIILTLSTIMRTGLSLNLRNTHLGACAAMIAIFFIVWILAAGLKKERGLKIKAGVGIALVVMSMSLSSWWSFWFGFIYYAFFTRRKALVILLIIFGVGIFFSLGDDLRENLLIRDKSYESLENLHGRRMLWEDYFAASMERPVLGFGFAIGAREVGRFYRTNTHNSFFAALVGVGWLGIVILATFFISLARELLKYRHSRSPVWLACAAALAAGFLNSMSVSIFGEQWNPPAVVLISFFALHSVFLSHAKQDAQNKDGQKKKRWSC